MLQISATILRSESLRPGSRREKKLMNDDRENKRRGRGRQSFSSSSASNGKEMRGFGSSSKSSENDRPRFGNSSRSNGQKRSEQQQNRRDKRNRDARNDFGGPTRTLMSKTTALVDHTHRPPANITAGGRKSCIVHPVQNATTCGAICCSVQAVRWKHARNVRGISDHQTSVVRNGRLKDELREGVIRARMVVCITTDCSSQRTRVASSRPETWTAWCV
jgi:hypothetical protein